MQGPIRCVFVTGLLTGCNPGGIGSQDDAPDIDAPVGPSALRLTWSSTPTDWPGSNGNGLTIEKARFSMSSLRIVGDASPGDPRTTIDDMMMGFAWDTDGQRPTDIDFDNAPTGLYSQVAIVFDRPTSGSNNYSYEIECHVDMGIDKDLRIRDDKQLTFNVDVDEMVSPGESAVIALRINFLHAIESLNFNTLDSDNGRLELEDGDAQMPAFRTKLIESFEVVRDAKPSG
jgi:hypothetical protein